VPEVLIVGVLRGGDGLLDDPEELVVQRAQLPA